MDDAVVMRGRYQATCKATGKRINAQVVHVFKISGGKIAAYQQSLDTAQLHDARSTGAAP